MRFEAKAHTPEYQFTQGYDAAITELVRDETLLKHFEELGVRTKIEDEVRKKIDLAKRLGYHINIVSLFKGTIKEEIVNFSAMLTYVHYKQYMIDVLKFNEDELLQYDVIHNSVLRLDTEDRLYRRQIYVDIWHIIKSQLVPGVLVVEKQFMGAHKLGGIVENIAVVTNVTPACFVTTKNQRTGVMVGLGPARRYVRVNSDGTPWEPEE